MNTLRLDHLFSLKLLKIQKYGMYVISYGMKWLTHSYKHPENDRWDFSVDGIDGEWRIFHKNNRGYFVCFSCASHRSG